MDLRAAARRLPAPLKKSLQRVKARRVRPLDAGQLRDWDRDGFVVLPRLFDPARLEQASARLDELWTERRNNDHSLVVDIFLSGGDPARVRLCDAPDEAKHQVYKLNDVYLIDEGVRSLILDERLLNVLRNLVGDDVVAFNSLHFDRGSTQGYHFDTFFMPPPPGGQLIVSSICLEDVHPDAGPLMYYPGSHRVPPYRNSDGGSHARNASEVAEGVAHGQAGCEQLGLRPATFDGNAGDVFIWHEQLFHGGQAINDFSRTRRSIVTHYWTKSQMRDWDVRPHGRGWYVHRPHQSVS